MSPSSVERRPEVGRQRRQGHRRAVKRAAGLDIRAQPFLGLGDLLRIQRRGAFVEHRHDHRLQAARIGRVGGIAGVERQRQLGHRHGGALRILQFDPVRQLGDRHIGEVERGERADRRDFALRPGLRRAGILVDLLAALGGNRLGFLIRRPGARLEPKRQGRLGQPLAHRLADVGRRDRGIGGKVLGIQVAVAGEGLPFGQRHRLAAEAADLLEPADPAADLGHRSAAHFVLGRALGDEIGDQLVEPFLDHRRVDARLDRRRDREDADPLERRRARPTPPSRSSRCAPALRRGASWRGRRAPRRRHRARPAARRAARASASSATRSSSRHCPSSPPTCGAGSVGTAAWATLLTGPRGIDPKYFSTSGRAVAASMSPASTSTALLGPYLSRNQLATTSRLAASRSAIEPIVEW